MRIASGGDAFFLFSAGGYHPEFASPASFPKLERLKISAGRHREPAADPHAATSRSRPTRGSSAREIDFFVSIGGVSHRVPDQLRRAVEPDVRFVVDFDVEFKIKYKGMTLFGRRRLGPLHRARPEARPGRVVGRPVAVLDQQLVRPHVRRRTGRPPRCPPADPLAPLVAALKDPGATGAHSSRRRPGRSSPSAPAGGGECSSIRSASSASARRCCRSAIQIDRFGGGTAAGRAALRHHVGDRSAGDPVTERRAAERAFRRRGVPRAHRRREDRPPVVRGDARGRLPPARGADLRRADSPARQATPPSRRSTSTADRHRRRRRRRPQGGRSRSAASSPTARGGLRRRRRSRASRPAAAARFRLEGPPFARRATERLRRRGHRRPGADAARRRRRTAVVLHAAVAQALERAPAGEPPGTRHACRSSPRSRLRSS